MSEENVEVVRRAWEASERRDNEAALALYDPTIEIHVTEQAGFDTAVYWGSRECRSSFDICSTRSARCTTRLRSGSTPATM